MHALFCAVLVTYNFLSTYFRSRFLYSCAVLNKSYFRHCLCIFTISAFMLTKNMVDCPHICLSSYLAAQVQLFHADLHNHQHGTKPVSISSYHSNFTHIFILSLHCGRQLSIVVIISVVLFNISIFYPTKVIHHSKKV